jgi:hypothetical protein
MGEAYRCAMLIGWLMGFAGACARESGWLSPSYGL